MRSFAFGCLWAATVFAQQPTPVQEHVTVNLVELTVHASDASGEPVRDLKASDFRVLVDGAAVEIESLEWSGTLQTEGAPGPGAPGRLMVLMFQWEIQAQKAEGHMRMSRQALEFVDTLEPDDRVAVMTFGSRLWLRQDFTSDHALLRSAILNALVARDAPKNAEGPTLAPAADASATSIDKAFLAIGRTLRPLPGAKAIVFFGWGIGSWNALSVDGHLGTTVYAPDFEPARAALQSAQAQVFALDTSGGSHQLQEGLSRLAFETGGFYFPTHEFPRAAMKTVARAVSGHYALVFKPPPGPRGVHTIQLLSPRKLVLFYRQTYEN
jgi:VWFA-related protein